MKKTGRGKESSVPGLSEVRYATLGKRIGDRAKRVTADTVKAALGSHDDPGQAVCVHPPQDGRLGLFSICIVMELSDPPTLHLSSGPPCSAPFTRHIF